MSAPVDVLAVLARVVASYKGAAIHAAPGMPARWHMEEALAGVAELRTALEDCCEASQPMAQMHATKRGRKALARFKGGAA